MHLLGTHRRRISPQHLLLLFHHHHYHHHHHRSHNTLRPLALEQKSSFTFQSPSSSVLRSYSSTSNSSSNTPDNNHHSDQDGDDNDAANVADFILRPSFLAQYHPSVVRPPFGFNGLGEVVYRRTYSRTIEDENAGSDGDGQTRNEEWHETVARVVTGCFRMQQRWALRQGLGWDHLRAQRSAEDMYDRIFHMKFLPPGRGLWAMGSAITEQRRIHAALNNCFAAETEIITTQGIRRIADLDGQMVTVMSRNGQWIQAPVRSFGKQRLLRLTLHHNGTGSRHHTHNKVFYTTQNHRWFIVDPAFDAEESEKGGRGDEIYREVLTRDLRPGDKLQNAFDSSIGNRRKRWSTQERMSQNGVQHGIEFATNSGGSEDAIQLAKCWMPPEGSESRITLNSDNSGDVIQCDIFQPPSLDLPADYLYGFLAGYFAAAGSFSSSSDDDYLQCVLTSPRRQNMQIVRDVCAVLGIGTYGITTATQDQENLRGESECVFYSLSLMVDTLTEDFFLREDHRTRFTARRWHSAPHWQVVTVEPTDREELVYCATVPVEAAFALDGNILTGNCAFVSTEHMARDGDPAKPFAFLMDMSMLGVGVGFDTKGAGSVMIQGHNLMSPNEFPSGDGGTDIQHQRVVTIADSREGWVQSVRLLLESYFHGQQRVEFDYSQIRPAGAPVRGFGGVSSGPEPLRRLHEDIIQVLERERQHNKDSTLSATGIVDLMNLIGRCVVSGNIRRCLPAGTLVHTERGAVPIEKVKVGDRVVTPAGIAPVNALFDQGVQNTVFIEHQFGTFECTPNHRVAVFNGINDYIFKRADQLIAGDRLVWDMSGIDGRAEDTIVLPHLGAECPSHGCTNIPTAMIPKFSVDIAWLLGYLHGDNSHIQQRILAQTNTTANSLLTFSCSNDFPTIIDKLQSGIRIFGVEPELIVDESRTVIIAHSTMLADYFLQFKQSPSSIDVPSVLFEANRPLRQAYIAGLFDANSKSHSLCSVSSSMDSRYLQQVKQLCATLGIATHIKLAHLPAAISEGNRDDCKPLYELQVTGIDNIQGITIALERYSLKFNSENEITLSCASEMTAITSVKGIESKVAPISVMRVFPSGRSVQTYDIEVEGIHQFTAEGFVVHNSAEIAFGPHDSEEFMDLKDYDKNPHRATYGWTSNNSLLAKLGMDYGPAAERIQRNGEPGFAWLDNMQLYGRLRDTEANNKDHRVQGANPCSEQSLESYELCCVSGETRILTRTGYPHISQVVGQEVQVWNGHNWSTVRPFVAAQNKPLFRVHLSDGSYLDCTSDHRWSVVPPPSSMGSSQEVPGKEETQLRPVETQHLEVGSVLEQLIVAGSNDGIIGHRLKDAYKWGIQFGTGPSHHLHQGQQEDVTAAPAEHGSGEKGYPNWLFELDRESTLLFVAGLIDSQGSEGSHIASTLYNKSGYNVFGTLAMMRDLQLILRRVGINSATITLIHDTVAEEWQYNDRYCCVIPITECEDIASLLRIAPRMVLSSGMEIIHQRQTVVRIEQLPGLHTTYCFSEPQRHMGVFGNVLTYQCLVETFPDKHYSLDDYLLTLKAAFLYAKTVTLGSTHWPETNRVMLRNRRIGCSMSGIAQFITKRGIEELRHWCEAGYAAVQEYDQAMSEWLAIPRSVKTTSIKPSGTVSLLAGATPGMHYPESRFYIRRLRLPRHSELMQPLQDAGYHIEPAVDDEANTLIVEFPVDAGEGIRTVGEVSMWEQLSLAAFLQRHWADNQVSCTVTFDPTTEGPQIKHALDYFQYQLKGISLLPRAEMGQTVYKQMPYESITEERYSKLLSQLKPLELHKVAGEQATPEPFCDADRCELPPAPHKNE